MKRLPAAAGSEYADIVLPRIPAGVTTPEVLLDIGVVEANLARMQALADRSGVRLRPHVKTHKSVELGRRQLAAGAAGITAGTLGEVEVFAAAGFDDIFFAFPVWAEGARVGRLRSLHEAIRLRVAVDSRAAAEALAVISRVRRRLEVLIEVDCGAGRCGVPPADAGGLAAHARSLGLEPVGAFTYPGHGDRSPEARGPASDDEVAALEIAAAAMTAEGIEVRELSAGSTPTAALSARAPVTEIRPGEYACNDLGKYRLGACGPADLALFVAATVVSDAVAGQVIVDVGTKALGREGTPEIGYGRATALPGAVLARLNEYHGYLSIPDGVARPRIGEVVAIAPNHVCPVINLFDQLLVHRDGQVVGRWPVDARGHLN
jgi:D-serine deaminase-like pyridoxal phosphate-dependent protein